MCLCGRDSDETKNRGTSKSWLLLWVNLQRDWVGEDAEFIADAIASAGDRTQV